MIVALAALAASLTAAPSLSTGVNAMGCGSLDGAMAAFNARNHGWTYVSTAGVEPRLGENDGDRVDPAHFGCRLYPAGIAIEVTQRNNGFANTNLGWMAWLDIAEPAVQIPKAQAVRPTLCNAHGTHCVYTDVHPHQPVP